MPAQTGYSVGWFTLALINAGLAQGKGRPGGLWMLISLLAGPLATLLIVALPPLTEAGLEGSGRHPRPLSRADWIVAGAIVIVLLLVIAALAAPMVMTPRLSP